MKWKVDPLKGIERMENVSKKFKKFKQANEKSKSATTRALVTLERYWQITERRDEEEEEEEEEEEAVAVVGVTSGERELLMLAALQAPHYFLFQTGQQQQNYITQRTKGSSQSQSELLTRATYVCHCRPSLSLSLSLSPSSISSSSTSIELHPKHSNEVAPFFQCFIFCSQNDSALFSIWHAGLLLPVVTGSQLVDFVFPFQLLNIQQAFRAAPFVVRLFGLHRF